jgi:molybdenum cofactor synthesis domain-containing protein
MSTSVTNAGQPSAGILIIGDEILSGRTHDVNTHLLAKKLTDIGINLIEVRVVSDNQLAIVSAINALRDKYTYLFTSGGIGPTHDDITADSIAVAFEVGISIREDAKRILSTNYIDGEKALNDSRLRMARIPDGADLIDNPISKAPGFSLENVYVMAGVPLIFEAMVDSILPNLIGGPPLLSVTIKCPKSEGDIAMALGKVAERFPEVSIGSYPYSRDGIHGTNIVTRHFDKKILENVKKELTKIL